MSLAALTLTALVCYIASFRCASERKSQWCRPAPTAELSRGYQQRAIERVCSEVQRCVSAVEVLSIAKEVTRRSDSAVWSISAHCSLGTWRVVSARVQPSLLSTRPLVVFPLESDPLPFESHSFPLTWTLHSLAGLALALAYSLPRMSSAAVQSSAAEALKEKKHAKQQWVKILKDALEAGGGTASERGKQAARGAHGGQQ